MNTTLVACRELLLDANPTPETFEALCDLVEGVFLTEAPDGQFDTLLDYALSHLARWPTTIPRRLPVLWPDFLDSALLPPTALALANTLDADHIGVETLLDMGQKPELAHIERVIAASANMSDNDLRTLANATFAPTLRELDLRYANCCTSGVLALFESPHTWGALEILDLRYNILTDPGLIALANASWLTRLHTLRLQRNQLGPDGIEALAGAPHLASLRELDLRYNPIGPQGARALAHSPHLANLSRLRLMTDDIGPEGIAALAASPTLNMSIRRLWRARQ